MSKPNLRQMAAMAIPLGADSAEIKRERMRFVARGFELVRLLAHSKKPYDNGWPGMEVGPDDFKDGDNYGVKMGDRHGSADGDMDCAEAIAVAPVLLPPTGMIWGHDSAPFSHYIYHTTPRVLTVQYADPLAQKSKLAELRGLKKDGTVGLQTMGPWSRHPEGELVRFEAGYDGPPANVAGDTVRFAMDQVAAASALARYFPPPKGGRNAAFLHLAGAAVRAGWRLEQTVLFNRAIYRALWGDAADFSQAAAEVKATYEKHAANQPLTGRRSLLELIDQRVIHQAFAWLGWTTGDPLGDPPDGHRHAKFTDGQAQDGEVPPREEPPPYGSPEPPPGNEQPPHDDAAFKFTWIKDLLAEPEEAHRWLLDGILPTAGLSLLVSKPKVGKSTWARCLAVAVARGDEFMGRATVKGPVLYLALEEKRGEIRRHFALLGVHEEQIAVHAERSPAQWPIATERALKLYDPVLVIADTALLDTLPPREFRAGYAEVAKYGLIGDAESAS